MDENGEFFPFAEHDLPDVIVVIVRFKSHLRSEGEVKIQAVRRLLAEGIGAFGGFEGRIEADGLADRVHDIVEIAFHDVRHTEHLALVFAAHRAAEISRFSPYVYYTAEGERINRKGRR